MADRAKRAIALRSKDREFHGLEREFGYHQVDMLAAYEKSKDIKHPRDVGDTREEILRRFLSTSGYLPARYAVSDCSARVASSTGHISKEIDILVYDALKSISLMKREDVYEVFPVESVYGVIQVKSRLNKAEIRDGLANLASFKRLDRLASLPRWTFKADESDRGFGILFAYDTDLEWLDIIDEIKSFANKNPPRLWANGIFVLSKGAFIHGENTFFAITNGEIDKIRELQLHGRPDAEGHCLFNFHALLLRLLRNTLVSQPQLERYFRLPLIADEFSYEFNLGNFGEMGECPEHRDFQRKISRAALQSLIDWCRATEPINWVRAMDLAYGGLGDNIEAYERQPAEVRIYNPENLSLPEILTHSQQSDNGQAVRFLAYDTVTTTGMTILSPIITQ